MYIVRASSLEKEEESFGRKDLCSDKSIYDVHWWQACKFLGASASGDVLLDELPTHFPSLSALSFYAAPSFEPQSRPSLCRGSCVTLFHSYLLSLSSWCPAAPARGVGVRVAGHRRRANEGVSLGLLLASTHAHAHTGLQYRPTNLYIGRRNLGFEDIKPGFFTSSSREPGLGVMVAGVWGGVGCDLHTGG